jgi:HPt (histidine-containing phosphotransfer) domain-containing protein
MEHAPSGDFPVLDDAALQVLREDVGEAAARAFMEDYLLMLIARAVRIVTAFARRDDEASLDAVLSLRASSEMAGAVRLAQYCRDLEMALKNGQRLDARTVRAGLSGRIRHVILDASRRGHLPPQRAHIHP